MTPRAADRPWRTTGDKLLLRVRVTPKAGRDAIDGLAPTTEGPALKARVRAAPEDGEANAAVVACIADWLGVAKRDVAISAGHKSRVKSVVITGNPADIEQRLHAACATFEA